MQIWFIIKVEKGGNKMNDMTLVIMAAGMGSRFGGLKQIEPVNDYGNFIIDYSIYDAIRAGFKKVVFIIKEENFEIFKDTIGKRIEDKIDVEYVFQKMDTIPEGVVIPEGRVKPWGTSHAILACKDAVKGPFAVINADDFYGFDPFKKIVSFFEEKRKDNEFVLISYLVGNTMTENGAVKRGICYKDENNYLTKIVESSVERVNGKIIATPLEDGEAFEVTGDTSVSMNFFGLTPKVFDFLEEEMVTFFNNHKDSLDKCEFLLPVSLFDMSESGRATVEVESTNAVWHGITYKEDKDELVRAIKALTDKGEYPRDLWS